MLVSAFAAVAMVVAAPQTPASPPNPASQSQTPPSSPAAQDPGDATDLGTVIVEGTLQQRVERFVEEVGAPPPGQRLARWDDLICVGVANMNVRYAQFMADRVSQRAADLDLTIGEPGCRPNILVVATNDASGLAARLIDANPKGFRPSAASTDLGQDALERFRTSTSPVRWWHVSLPVSVDTGEVAANLDGEPPVVAVRDASRLRSSVREDLARVLIILDVSRIGEISFGALSDYVAMVALAQVDPAADMSGYPTILNLFAERSATAALTDWDRDYLTSLYSASRDRARASQQVREIGAAMIGARRADESAPAHTD